jgi:MFS family permease
VSTSAAAVDRIVRPTRVRFLVLAALCAVSTLAYVQRNSYGGVETTIRGELGLTPDDTGNAAGGFFLTYALLQIPSGWLAQRLGPRRTLAACAAGWSAALGVCALAHGPAALVGGRLAMGALQAGLFPCATLVVAAWLSPAWRGTASALLNTFMLLGAALNYNLTGFLLGPLGWRGLFWLYAFPGLAWALAFLVWFRDRPEDHPGVNPAELAAIRGGRPAAPADLIRGTTPTGRHATAGAELPLIATSA